MNDSGMLSISHKIVSDDGKTAHVAFILLSIVAEADGE